MRYIALLRGINVGGNNKVPMGELKQSFLNEGFTHVLTYINSGNVLFETAESDQSKLTASIEAMLEKTFGFPIRTTVISAVNLEAALLRAPAWWGSDPAARHNALFVIPPATPQEILNQVGEIRPEYEHIAFSGQIIFWSAAIETIGRTRWAKIVGTKPYQSVTIRNANTTRKLLELAQA